MEDRELIFFGTFGLIVFNLLIVIFSCVAINSLGAIWPVILGIVIFGGAALYFDYLVIRYFINKIKEKTKK